MLISCPNCAAGYNVPDHLLAGAGRTLRCARCQEEFLATADEPALAVPQFAPAAYPHPIPDRGEIALSESDERPPPRPPVRRASAVAAWALSMCVLLSLGWGAVHWRSEVMSIWPPSQRAYHAVGLLN